MYDFSTIKIVVAGSNKDGNDKAKQEALEIFAKAGFDVINAEDIWSKYGCDRVTQVIVKADILYVSNVNQHIDLSTIARLAIAKSNKTLIVTSRIPDHPVLQHYVSRAASPTALVKFVAPEFVEQNHV